MNVVIPIVHLNGTSVESLLEAREKVYGAIGDLLSALGEMAPNGRDYYLESGRMDRAVEQHDRRVKMLTDLRGEILAEVDALWEMKR